VNREEAFALVSSEVDYQRDKWLREDGDWPSSLGSKYLVLGEEVGEIANAILEGDLVNARRELAQVAAVCVSWLMAEYES